MNFLFTSICFERIVFPFRIYIYIESIRLALGRLLIHIQSSDVCLSVLGGCLIQFIENNVSFCVCVFVISSNVLSWAARSRELAEAGEKALKFQHPSHRITINVCQLLMPKGHCFFVDSLSKCQINVEIYLLWFYLIRFYLKAFWVRHWRHQCCWWPLSSMRFCTETHRNYG